MKHPFWGYFHCWDHHPVPSGSTSKAMSRPEPESRLKMCSVWPPGTKGMVDNPAVGNFVGNSWHIYILHYVLYYVYTVYVYVYIYSVKQYIRHSWTLSYNIIYSNPPKKDINVESQELLFLWSFHNPEMSHPQVLDRRCNPHRDHQRCHRLGNSYVHFSWRKHQKTRLKGWTCASEATRSPHSFVCLASKWWFAANLRPKMRKTMRFWGVHKIFPENQNRAMEYIPSLVEILRVTGDEWTGTFSSLRYNSMILKTC